MSYLPVFMFIPALCASYLLGYAPLFISVIYIVLSVITFLAYAKDKSAAKNGMWRVSEGTLHTLSLVGGWPGAIVAQQLLRHKTKKSNFRTPFWITVLINCSILAWLHTNWGAIYLNTYTFMLEELVLGEMSNSNLRTILLKLLGFHA